MTVIEHSEMAIRGEDDIVLVRRRVRDLAQACSFDTFATAAVTTAASELARNVWVHGGGGVATLERIADDTRYGVRAVFRDEGPGIADVQSALAGGRSTVRSMGLGLSGSRRLVDEFDLTSEPGRGTMVAIVKWAPF